MNPITAIIAVSIFSIWTLSNIIAGIIGIRKTKASWLYFWQMNMMWNIINLLILIFAVVSYLAPTIVGFPSDNNPDSIKSIIFLNIYLDMVYQVLGALSLLYGKYKNKDRFIGYGYSIIIQGFFLLLFDLYLFFFL